MKWFTCPVTHLQQEKEQKVSEAQPWKAAFPTGKHVLNESKNVNEPFFPRWARRGFSLQLDDLGGPSLCVLLPSVVTAACQSMLWKQISPFNCLETSALSGYRTIPG